MFATGLGLGSYVYPAFSFGVVAAAYLFDAPGNFGKRYDGRRSRSATLLLIPTNA